MSIYHALRKGKGQMWTGLESRSANLEQVFNPLHAKAMEYDRAWSIAELKLTKDDVEWLKCWFNYLTPESTENWSNFMMQVRFESHYHQMLGSLLICIAAEICREECNEDSVWPTIRSILSQSHELRRELFLSNGQPSQLAKEIIASAVRTLNLRNVMDIEGTQQWFITIKLQYGFTFHGAKNRLAEWLVNLGQPHAVQYLSGETEFSENVSESFQSLWRALKLYRRDLIGDTEIRKTLQLNPWIKSHWIDDLLVEAKAKIILLGTEEFAESESEVVLEEAAQEDSCPIANISLAWPHDIAPRLRIQLDRQNIEDELGETEVGELDFYVDGRKLTRWLRQKDGTWAGEEYIYAEPSNFKNQPNLSPQTLTIRSSSGDSLFEWDFADSGLSEEVLVFDLDRERSVTAGEEKLEPNRRYAIICDPRCKIEGSDLEETYTQTNNLRKAFRLAIPLDDHLCVSYGEFLLWQPLHPESQHYPLLLTTPASTLNERAKLFLDGLPDSAEVVKLLIHRQTYELQRENGRWSTLVDVAITPEFAARQRRVWVSFSAEGKKHSQKPRLELSLLGVAMLRHKQIHGTETTIFEVLDNNVELNRSEGTAYLRVWTPERDKSTIVTEDDCQVGRVRHNKIRLKDFLGHGGNLNLLSDGKRYDMGVPCIDTGCVRNFLPSMFNCDAQLFLLSDKNYKEARDNGYVLYQWLVDDKFKAKIHRIPNSCIQPNSRDRAWQIRISENPLAVGITWKGTWLGAWWSRERISDYLNKRDNLPSQDFALLKWIRVPVLCSAINEVFGKAITHAPCRFIDTWLYDTSLPDGLKAHEHVNEIDSVIRHFLWNNFPSAHAKDAISSIGQYERGSIKGEKAVVKHLRKLSDISPILLWIGIENYQKQNSQIFIPLITSFTYEQVGLLPNASEQQFRYRIQGLEKRLLGVTGLTKGRLKEIVQDRIITLPENRWCPLGADRIDLMNIGQTQSGRQYLSASIGQQWLEQARG